MVASERLDTSEGLDNDDLYSREIKTGTRKSSVGTFTWRENGGLYSREIKTGTRKSSVGTFTWRKNDGLYSGSDGRWTSTSDCDVLSDVTQSSTTTNQVWLQCVFTPRSEPTYSHTKPRQDCRSSLRTDDSLQQNGAQQWFKDKQQREYKMRQYKPQQNTTTGWHVDASSSHYSMANMTISCKKLNMTHTLPKAWAVSFEFFPD